MSAAEMLDVDGRPLRVVRADLASFTGAGYGTLRIPASTHLQAGQAIVVTDDEANVLGAEVLVVTGDTAEVRVRWR